MEEARSRIEGDVFSMALEFPCERAVDERVDASQNPGTNKRRIASRHK